MATIIQQEGSIVVFLSEPESVGIDTSNNVIQVGSQPPTDRALSFARLCGFHIECNTSLAMQPTPILAPESSS